MLVETKKFFYIQQKVHKNTEKDKNKHREKGVAEQFDSALDHFVSVLW